MCGLSAIAGPSSKTNTPARLVEPERLVPVRVELLERGMVRRSLRLDADVDGAERPGPVRRLNRAVELQPFTHIVEARRRHPPRQRVHRGCLGQPAWTVQAARIAAVLKIVVGRIA